MSFPDFFDSAPRIEMRDSLAAFLGTAPDGRITYRYTDAVRLTGHSCPTVAGAWLMVLAGLDWLYEDALPERGGIEVHMRDALDAGTTGVVASVATLVTGAAPETGFGGIGAGHRFARRGLLRFEAPIDGVMALRRVDSGAAVTVDIDTGRVPHDAAMAALMPRAVEGVASPDEAARFALLWQDRVRRILEQADDPKLIHLYEWEA